MTTLAGGPLRIRRARHLVERVRRAFLYRSFFAALLIALARSCSVTGFLFLILWSYSIWGSTESPLRYLFVPAVVLLSLSIVLRLIVRWLLLWTRRYSRTHERRSIVIEKIRMSQEVRLPDAPHDKLDS